MSRPLPRTSPGTTVYRWLATMALAALTATAAACTGTEGGPSGTNGGGGGAPTGGGNRTGSATGGDQPTTAVTPTDPGASTTAAQAPADNRPIVGDIELSTRNVACSYVPNGNLDGSDGLTVFAYALLIGANELPRPATYAVSFGNGYSTVYTGHPSNSATKAFQGPVRSGDWGGTLTVRVVADPDDAFRETDEVNNAILVTVSLPANRAVAPIDPLPCSTRRG